MNLKNPLKTNAMEINKLIEISREINAESITKGLEQIKAKMAKADCDLVLPFVGEFSSGKTTLINALTDSKQLETNFDPTTATIFEVHFGCNSCGADVFNKDGKSTHFENIADLKNDKLADIPYVLISDTSKKVPSSTIIVDTPGLSSPDPRHKQTLANFLPQADGIILVVDVNQPITRSLTEFIKTMKLSNRPVFLVITKCDTKTIEQVDAQKKYIASNCEIDIKQTACVSAKNNDIQQLYDLFQSIMAEKGQILKNVNEQRMKNAADALKERIDEMLKASCSDKELDESINKQKADLNNLNRKIDRIISDSRNDIEEVCRMTSRRFQDTIVSRLNSIATAKGINYDAEATNAINTTATILLNEFKGNVQQVISQKAKSNNTDGCINLQSLNNIDMSNLNISGIGYDMNLNSMGHEYDGIIKTGAVALIAVAAVAAAPAVLGASGTAAAAGGTAAAGGAAAGGVSTSTLLVEGTEIGLAAKALSRTSQIQQNAEKIENRNGGFLGNLIGTITDKTMGKPQRLRAINNYVDSTLAPAFKAEMDRIGDQISNAIGSILHSEAEATIAEMNQALQNLVDQRKTNKEEFEHRMSQLREYRNLL